MDTLTAIKTVKDILLPDKKSTGEQIVDLLSLEDFKYPWIMRIYNSLINIYVVIVDSRYPNYYLPITKVRRLRSLHIFKSFHSQGELLMKGVKYTPPVMLRKFNKNINDNSLIILLDIAGERFINNETV